MLQNIREIGIFMVAAQAVVHFVPGRQYEKYVKSISSVIILLLFLKPFLHWSGGQWQLPEVISQKAEEIAGQPDVLAGKFTNGVETEVIRQMEEKIRELLNQELAEEGCLVKQVRLTLTERTDSIAETPSFSVEVVIGSQEEGEIVVEEIVVGAEQEPLDRGKLSAYRLRIAEILKLAEDCVEVRY